jgi:hypothetical protein
MSVGDWETEHYILFWKKGGCTVSFLGTQKWELDIYIGFSSAFALQCIPSVDLREGKLNKK